MSTYLTLSRTGLADGVWPGLARPPEVGLDPLGPSTAGQAGNVYTVILASGLEDGGKRATLALSMGCTALSMDLDTHLFLVGAGSYWAYQGHADGIRIDGFPSLEELLETFVDLDGDLSVCSTCDQALCHATSPRHNELTRRPGVRIQGMAALMDHLMQGRAVTF